MNRKREMPSSGKKRLKGGDKGGSFLWQIQSLGGATDANDFANVLFFVFFNYYINKYACMYRSFSFHQLMISMYVYTCKWSILFTILLIIIILQFGQIRGPLFQLSLHMAGPEVSGTH